MLNFFETQFGFGILLMAVLIGVILTSVAYCILLERKISAWVQDRIGPNRVGPRGLLQPLADGVKFLLKEDIITPNVDRWIFILAPAIAFVVAMVGFAVIPWGGALQFADGSRVLVQVASVDIGLLYVLGIGSMSVYGVVLGGWASNNKYSFYGAMRATAQMLSYEIPMGISVLIVVLTTGQLRLENIVDAQIGSAWNVVLHPLAFVFLLITSFAETNRTPFDLAEAEQELIGGYQTEYSSMKMALFYLGEYAHMITSSAFMAVLFLGGWELFPFSDRLGWSCLHWFNHAESLPAVVLRMGVMFGKVTAFICFFMWVRWTLPRFRFDQLMRLAWRGLVPVGMGMLGWTGFVVYIGEPMSIWAPIGELVLLAAVLGWIAVRNPIMTGRQANMRAVASAAVSR